MFRLFEANTKMDCKGKVVSVGGAVLEYDGPYLQYHRRFGYV